MILYIEYIKKDRFRVWQQMPDCDQRKIWVACGNIDSVLRYIYPIHKEIFIDKKCLIRIV